MSKIYYFQSFPDIIYDESGKKIKEFIGGFDRKFVCEYINDVFEKEDRFITNNSAYYHYISDRCRNQCQYLEFENKFTEGFKEHKKERQSHKHKTLDDNYIFKFGKFKDKVLKDVPDWYVEWFKINVPKSKW